MAQNYREMGRRHVRGPHAEGVRKVNELVARLEATGELPHRWEEAGIPPTLEEQWKTQAQRLVDHNIHELIGLEPDQYRATLPQFLPPEKRRLQQVAPLIVETRVPVAQLCQQLGVIGWDHLNTQVADLRDTTLTLVIPYTSWFDDGKQDIGKSVAQVQRSSRRQQATFLELLMYYMQYPDAFKGGHGICAPGSEWQSRSLFQPRVRHPVLRMTGTDKVSLQEDVHEVTYLGTGKLQRSHSVNTQAGVIKTW